jgi:hypothetical protein
LLAIKEIGQNGLKFVQQLSDTQMYSNYCQSLKNHSSSTTVDGSVHNPLSSYKSPRETGPGNHDPSSTSLLPTHEPDDDYHHYLIHSHEEEEFDSITCLFEVILSGSIAMEEKLTNWAKLTYEKLYHQPYTAITSKNMFKVKDYFISCNLEKFNRIIKSRERLTRYISKLIKTIALTDLQSISLDLEASSSSSSILSGGIPLIRYCNGLLCNGFCNTELCSEICLKLWIAKVKKLRHHQVAYDIVSKKYEKRQRYSNKLDTGCNSGTGSSKNRLSALVSSPLGTGSSKRSSVGSTISALSMETDKSSSVAGGPKIEFITKVGPHYEAQRHYRETESQYRQRKSRTENFLKKSFEPITLPPQIDPKRKTSFSSPSRSHHPRSGSGHSVTGISLFPYDATSSSGYRPKYVKKRKFLSSPDDEERIQRNKSSTTAINRKFINALAKYYSKKEEKIVKKYLKCCKQRISRFLLKYVIFYRKIRFHHAVLFLQSVIRGFLLRNKFIQMIHDLTTIKYARFFAKMRIRNFVRNHLDQIIKAYKRRKVQEQRRRLAQISIPIAPPFSVNALSNHNGMTNIASQNVSLAQNMTTTTEKEPGKASPTIKSRSRSESPLPFFRGKGNQPPVKYINDPKLPTPNPGSSLPVDPSQLKGNTPLYEKKNLRIEVPPQVGGGKIGNESPEGEAVFISPHYQPSRRATYAEKARDFLQFGKILKRSTVPNPTNPKFPMRRKSTESINPSDVKKSDGVAIPFPSDSPMAADTNHGPSFPQDYPVSDPNDSPSKEDLVQRLSENDSHGSVARVETSIPFQQQQHETSPFAEGQSVTFDGVPVENSIGSPLSGSLPPVGNSRRSLDSMTSSVHFDLRGTKSQSSDGIESASASGAVPDELSSVSSFPKMSFFSISEDPSNSTNNPNTNLRSNSKDEEGRDRSNSFFSKGLSSIFRSRSSDSDRSFAGNAPRRQTTLGISSFNSQQQMNNTSAFGSSAMSSAYSPTSIGIGSNSRDSFDIFDTTNTSINLREEETSRPPRRFSSIFDRTSLDGSFSNLFGGGSPRRRGSGRSSRGSVVSEESATSSGGASPHSQRSSSSKPFIDIPFLTNNPVKSRSVSEDVKSVESKDNSIAASSAAVEPSANVSVDRNPSGSSLLGKFSSFPTAALDHSEHSKLSASVSSRSHSIVSSTFFGSGKEKEKETSSKNEQTQPPSLPSPTLKIISKSTLFSSEDGEGRKDGDDEEESLSSVSEDDIFITDDLTTEFNRFPFKTLGHSAVDYVNRQQVSS